ncbi:porin family protein [Empedobacter sp. GD03865]|uniref:porin family protein n=1 Tax=Empedobacter sp. GD03865 TaxID=2975392 RepID=UPI0024484DB3|nr:porin family protein [Empedobacter sp. GD03865]MDH0658400.1 PorT family protein [Empedobacter sp. GD03865]
MKKIFFIAAAMLGVVSLSAQEKTTSSQFGIKSSVNMSSFNGDDVKDNDYKVGFSAGVYGHFPITDQFAVQPEVNFTRMGGKYKDEVMEVGNTTVKSKNKTTLDYIQVPVMLQFYPAGSRFNIEAGPQFGYNVYASNKTQVSTYVNNTVYNTEEKTDIKDNVKDFDFGVNFGLGYNVTDNINVGARYYMGLTKIGDNKNNNNVEVGDVKNHSFSIGVGYSF